MRPTSNWARRIYEALGAKLGLQRNTPIKDLSNAVVEALLDGLDGELEFVYIGSRRKEHHLRQTSAGIIPSLERRYHEASWDNVKEWCSSSSASG